MGTFLLKSNQQAVQGIPQGKLNDLDKRLIKLENNPSGTGDMLKSTYDPANGERQVAFGDQLPDITSLVPYAGADKNLNLNVQHLNFDTDSGGIVFAEGTPDELSIKSGTQGQLQMSAQQSGSILGIDFTALTTGQVLTVPDKTGTIALTSDITGGIKGQVILDFGSISQEDTNTTTTVLSTDIKTSSVVTISPSGVSTTDHDPEDYMCDGISAYITNIIDGISFDIIGLAQNNSWGQYIMNYVIS